MNLAALNEYAQWIALIVIALLLVGALRTQALHEGMLAGIRAPITPKDALPIGSAAIPFDRSDLRTKEPIHLNRNPGDRTLLTFLSTGCSSCVELIPHLNEVLRSERNVRGLVVISGLQSEVAELASLLSMDIAVVADPDGKIKQAYYVQYTPHVYVIDGGAIAASSVSNTRINLEDTLAGLTRQQGNSVPVRQAEPYG